VSRNVREEHRQALDWLNRGDGASTEYFGVVVELLQIDGSKPAVNLRVVASPNNWSRRSIRSEVRAEIYIDFGQRSQTWMLSTLYARTDWHLSGHSENP